MKLNPYFLFTLFFILTNCSTNKNVLSDSCKSFRDIKPFSQKDCRKKALTHIKENLSCITQVARNSLYFKTNCHLPIRFDNLKIYIGYLSLYKQTNVILEAHSDNKELINNPEIGIKRLKTIRKLLIRNGINPERISIVDLKSEYPIDTNETEIGRANNRRVEMKIKNAPNLREQFFKQ